MTREQPDAVEWMRQRRVPHPSDRRTILAELTAEGLQVAERPAPSSPG